MMRDLLFKNLISNDRKKRIIASSEVVEREGVRNIIRRHFVCMVKEVKKGQDISRPLPYLYVLKEHKTKEQKERFFCRIKGSLYAVNQGKIFLVLFMHSLKIELVALPEGLGA